MRAEDLDHLAVPGDPQLHPEGTRVAYVLSEIDVDEDRYLRTVHLWDGTSSRRLTHGPSDSSPRWSPDGAWLAFIRKTEDEGARPQLMLMPAAGGEPFRRTDLPLGVSGLAWSPDSSQLVIVAAGWREDAAELDDDERARRPKRITRFPYRTDSGGFVHDRFDHLHLVEVAGDDEPRQLTTIDRDHGAPFWRPDGGAIAFIAEPDDADDLDPHDQAFELDVASGECRPLSDPGMWSWAGYDPDGRTLLAGLRDPMDWPGTNRMWLVTQASPAGGDTSAEVAGARTYVDLTGHLDRDVLPGAPGLATVGPRFVSDGFVVAAEGRGTTGLVRVVLDGWDPEGDAPPTTTELVGGRRSVTGFAVRPDASALAFTVTDPATPGELVWSESGEAGEPGHERTVTDLAKAFRQQVDVRPTQRFTFDRDGAELDVWAVLPPGFDDAADGSVPLLLNIHGGPTSQYGEYFFDEFQVEAGAGYLAVGTNPRGSSGRGAEWARSVVGAWGAEESIDTLDLEAVVDAVAERYPQVDLGRVGVMGGSYGGYATARMLARTDRFGSAIVERGLLSWESFSGTSDIGPYFDRMFLDSSLVDGPDVHRSASPQNTASRITTPTLVLHSENDHRCPIEQGEQFYLALRRAGVETEMVRFPGETHELTRSGSPKHRVERFEIVLDWHGRYLGPRAS